MAVSKEPPHTRRMALAVLFLGVTIGVLTGIGFFTFVYAKGYSYITNDPEACANCHIMRDNYDAWRKSSHHNVAVCNDCHTPHNLIGKYTVKALNGFRHSFAFTTGYFPEPIHITEFDLEVTEHTCRYCHADIVQAIDSNHRPDAELKCVSCHKSVGHLE